MRRTAWTIPVLAVAPAAPALATSGCPSFTAVESYYGAASDQITVTNGTATSVPVPAGARITWVLENRAETTRAITISDYAPMIASTPLLALAAASGTTYPQASMTFTTTTPWVLGATRSWVYYTPAVGYLWHFRSRITVSYAGTALAGCPSFVMCTSYSSVYGHDCPV